MDASLRKELAEAVDAFIVSEVASVRERIGTCEIWGVKFVDGNPVDEIPEAVNEGRARRQ
jgi:hypothetical protein